MFVLKVASGNQATEDMVIDVKNEEEAEEFIQYLHNLGVYAIIYKFEDKKAVIRRIHQATTDKVNNLLNGGLY